MVLTFGAFGYCLIVTLGSMAANICKSIIICAPPLCCCCCRGFVVLVDIVIIVMSIFIYQLTCHHVYFHDYNDITFLFELIENIAQSSTYITLGLVVWSISTSFAGRTYFGLKLLQESPWFS